MKKRQKIKKIVSVLLTILMLQGIAVTSTVMTTSAYQVATAESQAQTQQINSNDSVYGSFRYTVSDNQVAITAYTGSESEVVIPSKIDDMPVTSIGNCAFHSCSVINVTIPNSVTSIGEGAFEVCVCLTSMTIPDSVTSIGHYAFAYCSNLTSVTIGNNVTNIGNGAFLECGLTSIDIPNSVTNIEDGAFWGCGRLIDITIGKNVKNIGASAFGYCSSLTDVEIANGVTSIGDYTFSDCSSLTSVTISNSVTKIGRYAFGYYDDGDMKKIDGFIINGEKNSKAESYAHNNGFTFVEFIPSKLIYCTITLSKTTYEYNGYSRKPNVTVKNGATTLTKDIDYTVVYKDNINAGTATVTIAGKDDYSGTVTETFVITKRPIKYTKVSLSQTSYDYDGTAIEPPVTVTYSGKVLMEGTDYIVSYENNITPGTANIVITGTGNCSGTKIIPFTILGDPIQNATIMLSQDTYTYNGYSRKPEVTVMLGTETLVKGTDYKVSYKDNINAGMATVVVTGINDYSGTVTENFMITTKLITQTKMTLSQTSYTYDGRAKTPAVTIMNGKKTLTENVDYTISYKNNINVGTAKVIVTGKGNYMGMLTKTFTIEN